ncbi:cytochrome C1 heme lyase [Trametes coccinea BRFM310]|uniref:Holocytochrome c-type synthase n=1 Tax=Trametes coccinea (strain BRFM310) TaxID=1353009 RepID=A0A1Y2IKJ5_TRAC3|nr:cytochrome C1 heme lyase [Trametes coccinea BRFM310]
MASASTSDSADKCPVDHSSFASSSQDKCPVDHTQRSTWASILGRQSQDGHGAAELPDTAAPPASLPLDREVSSIPRVDGGKWVYPSQAQFFAAMARKNHNPQERDMRVVVPIHNAVNERAWQEILKWEAGQGGDKCGGVKLVSFKGRPNDRTPRAWFYSLLGYSPPFDRHDWVVDRCGSRMRYVIDFYTGNGGSSPKNISFFLDVRPALDSWEGVRLRTEHFWKRWLGNLRGEPTKQENIHPKS